MIQQPPGFTETWTVLGRVLELEFTGETVVQLRSDGLYQFPSVDGLPDLTARRPDTLQNQLECVVHHYWRI